MLKYDDWLSSHLGKPAYHLVASPVAFKSENLPRASAFIDAKVSVEDIDGLVHLQMMGFAVIDTSIQLERQAEDMQVDDCRVRFAEASDVDLVREVARTAFTHNRFHRDPQISNLAASSLKAEWAANFFLGKRGRWMIVAEHEQQIVGFLQLVEGQADRIIIDLIAVNHQFRGMGLAREMLAYANKGCLGQPAMMQVGTQISNAASLAFYMSFGFRITTAAYLLHLHHLG